MIQSRNGRRYLLIILLAGFLLAFLTQMLLGRGGMVSEETSQKVVERILKIFVPLFALVGAFYFSEHGHREPSEQQSTSPESFFLAAILSAIWVFLPTIALLISQTFESALRLLV